VFSDRFDTKSIPGHDASLSPDFIDPVLRLWSDATTEVNIAPHGGGATRGADGSDTFIDLIFEVNLLPGNYAFSIGMGDPTFDDPAR
jgi:hypothetical protein